MSKQADRILDRDLKKDGYRKDMSKPGVYYKGSDEIVADKLSYSHTSKPFTTHNHLNGKTIK